MTIVMKEPVDYANRVSWEYKMRNNWVPYKADVQTKLEKGYKSGNCIVNIITKHVFNI